MKRIILLVTLYLCVRISLAQAEGEKNRRTDANIYGHVLDAKTGEHLPYVTLRLKGTTIVSRRL